MFAGNFNYHQILFTLDTFKHSSEKLTYLTEISSELNRIIDCFEAPKNFPLKMYASKDVNIEGNCKELQDFISKQYNFTNLNNHRRIYPGESQLKGLLRKELINYKKLSSLVDMEIKQLSKPIREQNIVIHEPASKNNFIIPLKTTPKYIVSLLTNNNEKIIWNKSIGELIDLMKIIMVLELHPEVDEKQIVNLICTRFVNTNHENYSHNQVVKTKETLENIFWQNGSATTPKYYQ
ncbi:MAG: hypothetical protein COW71_09615 [Ignavibacteriales bacterium CG18_big_fil_WC_8_21_14_2_50_31_20]|nr:MAG: hypothetical protein COW71_09615 [Ignavibacteriales bacterium CG18_big_fil_WC_8_21_14_2_50_31_20]